MTVYNCPVFEFVLYFLRNTSGKQDRCDLGDTALLVLIRGAICTGSPKQKIIDSVALSKSGSVPLVFCPLMVTLGPLQPHPGADLGGTVILPPHLHTLSFRLQPQSRAASGPRPRPLRRFQSQRRTNPRYRSAPANYPSPFFASSPHERPPLPRWTAEMDPELELVPARPTTGLSDSKTRSAASSRPASARRTPMVHCRRRTSRIYASSNTLPIPLRRHRQLPVHPSRKRLASSS